MGAPWRRAAAVTLSVIALGVGGVALLTSQRSGTPGVGERASGEGRGSVAGIVLDGFGTPEKVELASFEGKPLVINYWASWCPFCIAEMPDFEKVHQELGSSVAFLGVDIQDDLESAKRLAEQTGVSYPLASDAKGKVYERLRGLAMPTTWFVDERGTIVERFSGPMTADQLRARIREHFDI